MYIHACKHRHCTGNVYLCMQTLMNVFRVVLHAMLMLSAWTQWVDLTASANLATEEMGKSAVKVKSCMSSFSLF